MAGSYFPAPNDWVLMYNNYTGAGTYLSAINPSGGLLQMTSNTSPSASWQIFPSNGVYYIRNKAGGASLQLDVILSNSVYMPSLQPADIAAKGQQWSFASENPFWTVESAGAGSAESPVQLDTYSDTLQPFFEAGGHSGQLWSFSSVGKVNDVAFSTLGGVATASAPDVVIPTAVASLDSGSSTNEPPKASKTAPYGTSPMVTGAISTSSSTAGDNVQTISTNSSSHSLSTGAIAGIAVAAAVIGMSAVIGIGVFLWMRKTRARQQNSTLDPANTRVAEMAGDHQNPYDTLYKEEAQGTHAVEIGGTAVQEPNRISELPTGR